MDPGSEAGMTTGRVMPAQAGIHYDLLLKVTLAPQ
jgi:hypothetical protein